MKRRRRTSRISQGLFLSTIFLLFAFAFPALAQTTATVSIGAVSTIPDSSVTAPIMVNHVTNLGSGTIDVSYNPEIVHVTDVESGTGNALKVQSRNINNTIGLVHIVAMDANNAHSGNVIFANLTYKAVASSGSTPLNATVIDLMDYHNYTQISHTVTNGTFTITAQSTPFLTYGYAFYENGTACNGLIVSITNLNRSGSGEWAARTNVAYNYYQLVLADPTDVNMGETLQFNVKSPDGTHSNTTFYTVTREEINLGGFYNFNISLKPNFFDTSEGTYPSIMGVHRGNFTLKCNITVHQVYTYPCEGTGGHSERVIFFDGEVEKINESWGGYQGDYHNITISPPVELLEGKEYRYEIITGSYPQIIHRPDYENSYGIITCTEFIDVNGKRYNDWIPAIRLGLG